MCRSGDLSLHSQGIYYCPHPNVINKVKMVAINIHFVFNGLFIFLVHVNMYPPFSTLKYSCKFIIFDYWNMYLKLQMKGQSMSGLCFKHVPCSNKPSRTQAGNSVTIPGKPEPMKYQFSDGNKTPTA